MPFRSRKFRDQSLCCCIDIHCTPKKYLFAIEDLGRGASGRARLTCSSSGALCVLKFSLTDKLEELLQEEKVWKLAYPDIPVHVGFWCGHPALRMPHFCNVNDANKPEAMKLVKSTLQANFSNKGLEHQDVFWRNIGWYKDEDGTKNAIVFDMGSVVASTTDSDWIEKASSSGFD